MDKCFCKKSCQSCCPLALESRSGMWLCNAILINTLPTMMSLVTFNCFFWHWLVEVFSLMFSCSSVYHQIIYPLWIHICILGVSIRCTNQCDNVSMANHGSACGVHNQKYESVDVMFSYNVGQTRNLNYFIFQIWWLYGCTYWSLDVLFNFFVLCCNWSSLHLLK